MTRPIILRSAEAGTLDREKRYREFVASTKSLDSHGTIVEQNWNLDRYLKNPIVLWQHWRDEPIGKAVVRLEGESLIVGITFASGDENAERVWNLVQQDVLRAVSVGFRPGDWEIKEIGEGDWVVIYKDPELYEISVCSIGSNADAVARSDASARDEAARAEAASDEAEQRIRQELLAKTTTKATGPKGTPMTVKKEPSPVADKTEDAPASDTISRAAHDAEIRELQAANKKLDAELTEARKANAGTADRLKALENEAREAKLSALVGKKFPESELEEMRELLETNPGLFDRTMKKRKDIGFGIGKESIAKPDQDRTPRTSAARDDEADTAALQKRAAERMKLFGEDEFTALTKAADDLKLTS